MFERHDFAGSILAIAPAMLTNSDGIITMVVVFCSAPTDGTFITRW